MDVRCPQCHNPMQWAEETGLDDVTCPSCGGQFSLVGEETLAHESSGGETIAHFQLTERLGAGAFGTVWRAHDTELDRQVAVKVPRRGQLDAEESEKFLREARAAAQLKHPHIVAVHEVGRQDNTVYIVSDLIEGVTVTDWLTGRQPTPREAAELCEKIAGALQHAHDHGVVHRDLKPGNVMIDRQGEPHLMDFGLAKREGGEVTMTFDGQVLGTPAYMSPEQARGEGRQVDRRTDVYSLGVILFELLTGERPFRGSPRMLLHQLLTEESPSPRRLNASIPRDLETICLKAIAKDPAARYQTADDFAQDLRRFLRGEPILARPIGAAGKAWRWCRRNPVVAGLTAGLLLVLVAGLASVSSLWLVAEDRRARFEQERDEARREKRRADENFEQARRAVDEYFVRVSEDPLLKTQLLPLRKRLLEAALRYYQGFVQQRADDPDLQEELALAHLRVGEITAEIGSQEAALQAYQRARDLLLAQLQSQPHSVELRNYLALCRYQMGMLCTSLDRHDEARQSMRDNLQLRRQLAEERPDDRASQLALVDAYNGVAIAAARRYEPDPTALQAAVDVLQAMLQRRPDDHAARNRLGGMLNSIATAHMMQGRLDEANWQLQAAIEHQRQALEGDPRNEGYQEYLGNQLFNLGQLHVEQRRLELARSAYREARSIYSTLVRANPALVNRQLQLARACIALSNVEDDPAAAPLLEEAREILERVAEENSALVGNFLAEACSKLASQEYAAGDVQEAVQLWRRSRELLEQEVSRDPANRLTHLSNLARCHLHLCHALAEQDEHEAALQSGEQARKLYQDLLEESPDNAAFQRRLADTCNELGLLQLAEGRLQEAEQTLRQAVAMNEQLLQRQPQDPTHRVSAGGACCNLGNVFQEEGEAEEALKWYGRADELLTEALSDPAVRDVASQYLANTLTSRMSVLHDLERYADELRDCQRAVDLVTGDRQQALKAKLAELQRSVRP